jgi:signal transduction histidine kinase
MPLMESVRMLLGERVRLEQVTITTQLEEGMTSMFADAARLKQILFKLLANGVRATKSKGQITVRWFREENGDIALSVRDDGAAIDPNKQAAIFDPFFRGMAAQSEGVGLGLAIVKRFVELHGGRVTLYSAAGEGTTVTCFFPQDKLAALAANPPTEVA